MRVNYLLLSLPLLVIGCGEDISTAPSGKAASPSNVDCTVPHAEHIYAECASEADVTNNVGNFNVLSSTPANLGSTKEAPATGIALNQTFSVTFHHAFNPQSISRTTVRIMPNNRFANTLGDAEADEDVADHNDINAIIDANTTLSADAKTFTIRPVQALRPNTGYHLMFNVSDVNNQPASGALYFHTIRNQRISREEFDSNNDLDEKFEYSYDAQGNLVESIKWDVGRPSDGYIRREGAMLAIEQNGQTTNLQTERVEYKNEGAAGTRIADADLVVKRIRLRKEVTVAQVTSNALVDFSDPGIDTVWGTSDDTTGSVSLPGLNHLTHLMTNYYRGIDLTTGELSRSNQRSWPGAGTLATPLTTMETAFGYYQSIARQYRTSDRQIELRVDYRTLAGTSDPVTGIQGPQVVNGRFSPQFSGEKIDDYRWYIYNNDGKLVLRVDVNPRYGDVNKDLITWKLDGSESYTVNNPGKALHGQVITAIDDYRVYQYNFSGQLERYIEYEEDNENSNPVSLTPAMIQQFQNGTLTATSYVTDDKVDEEEVYTYSPTTGGLVERIEYRGAASLGQKADVDTYDATK